MTELGSEGGSFCPKTAGIPKKGWYYPFSRKKRYLNLKSSYNLPHLTAGIFQPINDSILVDGVENTGRGEIFSEGVFHPPVFSRIIYLYIGFHY
jgi:hypothetical protein